MSLAEDALMHHGVKGQKWGVRRGHITSESTKTSLRKRSATEVTVTQKPGKFVKTHGGKRELANPDAVKTAANRQLAKKSTTDALSTKDLQEAVNRMNLEQQYHKLVKKTDRRSRGQKFVSAFLSNPKNRDAATKSAAQVAKALRKSTAGV